MSFWGCIVAPGQAQKIESKAGETLHLSQACLAPDAAPGTSAKVLVEQGGTSFAVACLREGGQEFCALDLFLDAKEAKFFVKGKATVHLTGYFEVEDMDEEMEEDAAPKAAAKKEAKPAEPKAKAEPKAEGKAKAKAAAKKDDKEEEKDAKDKNWKPSGVPQADGAATDVASCRGCTGAEGQPSMVRIPNRFGVLSCV